MHLVPAFEKHRQADLFNFKNSLFQASQKYTGETGLKKWKKKKKSKFF